jgi:hypothetical protein
MSEEMLRLLFRKQKDQHASPTDSCPGDDRILRLLEPEFSGSEHAGLRAHVADCPYCTARLAGALRPSADGAVRRPGLRFVAIAAAAAIVAISPFRLQIGDEVLPGETAELRNLKQPEVVPLLTFPMDGQVVSPTDIAVQWTPVADAMHYSVRIVDDYGRIVVDSFSDTAEFVLPTHIRLAPGADYYVKIDAYVLGDKAVSSRHIHFMVKD